jgi:hypothetical protein
VSQGADHDALPLLAPLSESVIAFLLGVYRERHSLAPDAAVSASILEPIIRRFREAVYARLAPEVNQGLIKAGSVQQAISELTGDAEDLLSTSTLAFWRAKNLIRSQSFGRYEATSVAAFAITRLVTRELDRARERNLFPPRIDLKEPRYWCFAQLLPTTQRFACPVPFPPGLADSALCWTECWPGADWDVAWDPNSTWMAMPGGAISWAKGERRDQEVHWSVPLSALGVWDPEAAALDIPALEQATHILHTIADLVLIRQAPLRFSFDGQP